MADRSQQQPHQHSPGAHTAPPPVPASRPVPLLTRLAQLQDDIAADLNGRPAVNQ